MKKALLVILVLLLIVGFVVFRVWSNLDSIVAGIIEESGSQALKTPVTVAQVDIGLADGKAAVNGLAIANPAGFTPAELISLDSIAVDLDLESLGGEVFILETVAIGAASIFYEINGDGASNMQALLDSVGSDSEPQSQSVKLIIQELKFDGAKVQVKSQVGPIKEQEIELPGFTLRDLGKAQGGATPEEIAAEISERIAKDVISAAARAGVENLIDSQKDKLKEKLGGKLKNILDRG